MFKSQSPIIAVVTRPTRLQGLMRHRATLGMAEFSLKKAREHEVSRRSRLAREKGQALQEVMDLESIAAAAGGFEEYKEEDRAYEATLTRLRADLELGYPMTFVDRDFLPNFDFGRCVVVVVVGQDGLVANAAKYVGDTPIVGVNPDPHRYDGILLPFVAEQARPAVQGVIAGRHRDRPVTMAEVSLNDGQRMLAFNDLFVGCRSHVSVRYTLTVGGKAEPQSSSGIIISTGAGSTGWLSSLFNMTGGFVQWLGGKSGPAPRMKWEDRSLAWAVREPFISRHSKATLVAGLVNEGEEITVESLVPENGVIFSDGVEKDSLEFNSGTIASIKVSQQVARLVIS
jgi:NAD kinase